MGICPVISPPVSLASCPGVGADNVTTPKAFNTTYLKLSPMKTRVPLDITVGFSINSKIKAWDAIFVHLPQFTSGNCDVRTHDAPMICSTRTRG